MGQSRTGQLGNIIQRRSARQIIRVISLALLLMFLSIFILVRVIGISHLNTVCLDDRIKVDIIHQDGSIDHYDGNEFEPPASTDVMNVTVKLPFGKGILPGTLCFFYYNAHIRVFAADGKILCSRQGKGGRMTGHMMVMADLPNTSWGQKIRIEIRPVGNSTVSVLSDVYAMESSQAALYPVLVNGQFAYLLVLLLFCSSIISFFLFVSMKILGEDTWEGIWLSLFCLMGSLWAMGYSGLIYMFSDIRQLTAFGEYIAFFAMIPFFSCYCMQDAEGERLRLFYKWFSILSAMLTLLVSISEWTAVGPGYLDFMPLVRLLILSLLVIKVVFSFLHGGILDPSRKIRETGNLVTLVLAALEMVRILLNRLGMPGNPFAHFLLGLHLIPAIGVTFISTVVINYLVRLFGIMQTKKEKKELEDIAFRDPLTGIPNRNAITDSIRTMQTARAREYAIVFMDANDLKKANDVYGHETGDHYLRLIGRMVREAFGEKCEFYGRYGGDEFIVCARREKDARHGLELFRAMIEAMNREEYLPFRISVAAGMAVHRMGDKKTMDQTVKEADDQMYRDKCAQKGVSNVR